MSVQVSAIMLGVKDVEAAKRFYVDGLGCGLEQDYPGYAMLTLGEGSKIALYEWNAAAEDAGVSAEGSGFRGVSFHYITESPDAVDAAMKAAEAAGGSVVKEAAKQEWGGYTGWFSDLDGYLWKATTSG